jgi:hypothetical protein
LLEKFGLAKVGMQILSYTDFIISRKGLSQRLVCVLSSKELEANSR